MICPDCRADMAMTSNGDYTEFRCTPCRRTERWSPLALATYTAPVRPSAYRIFPPRLRALLPSDHGKLRALPRGRA